MKTASIYGAFIIFRCYMKCFIEIILFSSHKTLIGNFYCLKLKSMDTILCSISYQEVESVSPLLNLGWPSDLLTTDVSVKPYYRCWPQPVHQLTATA